MSFEINLENVENNKIFNKLFFFSFGAMFLFQFMLGQLNRVEVSFLLEIGHQKENQTDFQSY